jgi:hypothetical protein
VTDLKNQIEIFAEQKEEFGERIVGLNYKYNDMVKKYNDIELDYADLHRKNEALEKQFDDD